MSSNLPTAPRPWGVLLAAGASSRMGRHKLLLGVAGEPLVRRSARALLACDLSGVLVVLGRGPDEVRAALAGLEITYVLNEDYQQGGLTSSLALALRTLGEAQAPVSGAVLSLADMPFVGPQHLKRVLDTAQTGQAALSYFGDVLAPPHFIPRTAFESVQGAIASGLPRPLPRALADEALRVAQPPPDLLDIDDEATYVQVLERIAAEENR
jgi:molybdenum cofactor cytidylyltransferase